MRKIGIYGGTFDPVHHGHLILARDALEQLQLEEVVFVPAAASPHKTDGTDAPAPDRLAMLRAAIADEPGFSLDDLELHRPPPSFTIDSALAMRSRYRDAQLFYLLGEDNVAALHTWHRFEELRAIVTFVVLDRHGTAVHHPYVTIRRQIDISATEIRDRVATGRSVRYLLPASVEEIIRTRGLYREARR